MKVVITGGLGFLGLGLCRALLARGSLTGADGEQAIDEIVLFDAVEPSSPPAGLGSGVSVAIGDISDRATVERLVDRPGVSLFHLASVVSGGGEKDFDLAMRVNLDGGRHVMEALRTQGDGRLVFASSIAVFGGTMPAAVGDETKQTPQTTYGITKAIGEMLVNDYSRKGFLDGRSARLPTVIIRPGKPNAAASGFSSGVFREPLAGVDCVLPVGLETVMPVLGYRAVIEGMIRLHELPAEALGTDRAVGLPALTVTVADMIAALKRVAGNRPLGEIRIEPDPFVERICRGWPLDTYFDRALGLGLPREANLDEIVAYYIADHVDR